jgi:23S rRNA (guanosine2251-2'-O)-methyltransferase
MKRLIVGPRAVVEALHAHANEISVIFVAEDGRRELQEVAELAQKRNVSVEARPVPELDKLAKGQRHQGVVAIAGSYSYLSFEELMAQLP